MLLLAIGVGVLIGRSGSSSKQSPAPVEVVTQGGAPTGASAEASFTGDWPSGTSGYTVQLQTLPVSGTTVASVTCCQVRRERQGRDRGRGAQVRRIRQPLGRGLRDLLGRLPQAGRSPEGARRAEEELPGAKVIHVSETRLRRIGRRIQRIGRRLLERRGQQTERARAR